jgi:predicted alpha/beta-fold hydrolase
VRARLFVLNFSLKKMTEILLDLALNLSELIFGYPLLSILVIFVSYLLVSPYFLKSAVKLYYGSNSIRIKYVSKPKNLVKESRLIDIVKVSCPSLADARLNDFSPHPLLWSGHLQTIYASIYANYFATEQVKYFREIVTAPDGGIFSLDWTKEPTKNNITKTPYVLILHGLTGGSYEIYVQDLVIAVKKYGYHCVVMNFRGCANTPVSSPQLYSGSYTDDVKLTVNRIFERDPSAKVFGVGFSLGSNVLTKYVGQLGNRCPLVGMVSIGNPYDMLGGLRAMQRSFWGRRVYMPAMGKSLKAFAFKHRNAFKDVGFLDFEQIERAKNVREFDVVATSRLFGYKSVNEYYRHASSVIDIPYISVPSLFLSALDDPICSNEVIPYEEIQANPYTILAITKRGGHLGWFRNGSDNLFPRARWFATPVGEFIHAVMEAKLSMPDEESVDDSAEFNGTPWNALPDIARKQQNYFLQRCVEKTRPGMPTEDPCAPKTTPENRIQPTTAFISKLSRGAILLFVGFIVGNKFSKR